MLGLRTEMLGHRSGMLGRTDRDLRVTALLGAVIGDMTIRRDDVRLGLGVVAIDPRVGIMAGRDVVLAGFLPRTALPVLLLPEVHRAIGETTGSLVLDIGLGTVGGLARSMTLLVLLYPPPHSGTHRC